MIVSASTDCFEEMPLMVVYERLTDLEFSNVEIAIRDGSIHLTPEQVLAMPRPDQRPPVPTAD